MTDELIQLYPQPARRLPLQGAYLAHDLRQNVPTSNGNTFLYANFVVSLDGRIAVPRSGGDGMTVPQAAANERDWRLFQELAGQADLIISSGRYLRDWADGKGQEILQVDDPRFADIRAWRTERGLPPQPDIAIVSSSLRFPIPEVLTASGRSVVVFTDGAPDPRRVAEIEAQAGQVIVAGEEGVDGAQMARHMADLGYRLVYSAAGPKILHLLLAGGVLNRLYLTHAHRILGGEPFASIVEGPLFETAVDFNMRNLYYDPVALDGLGQLFLTYDRG